MPDASYWREWRAAHPEYRARQNVLRNERRRRAGRGDRAAEYAQRPSRAQPGLPPIHDGHVLFDLARRIVGPRRSGLTTLYDPLYDDLVSEAVIAALEGRDPARAVAAYRTRELRWGRLTAPLLLAEG